MIQCVHLSGSSAEAARKSSEEVKQTSAKVVLASNSIRQNLHQSKTRVTFLEGRKVAVARLLRSVVNG